MATAQAIQKRLEVRFQQKYAPAMYKQAGEAMVRHCSRAAAQKTSSRSKSIWRQIAKSVRYRMTFQGTKRAVVLCVDHPAAQLKEFGGTIHAGGPFSEPSPYHKRVADFIPLALSGTAAQGKQLGLQKQLKFGAAGGTSYSHTRLHSMPLSRYLTSSGSERFGRFATMVGKQIKKTASPAKRAKVWKDFIGSAKLVFRKASRLGIEPLYLLVKSCYIPAQPWIPSADSIRMAIVRSFRKS
jgi:hypothetical protein